MLGLKKKIAEEPNPTVPHWVMDGPDPESHAVFMGRCWHDIKKPAASHNVLKMMDGKKEQSVVSTWDNWIPGVCRIWTLPQEPIDLGDPISPSKSLGALLRLARFNGVDVVESFSNMARWDPDEVGHLIENGRTESFGTYTVDLLQGIDAVRAGMHSKHRYGLRKALAANLEARFDLSPSQFDGLMQTTYKRGGKDNPFSEPYLNRLIGNEDFSCLSIGVYSENRLEAALIVPFDNRRGYYLHGASRSDAAKGASIFGQVAAMEALISRGIPTYDLGGARAETDDKRLQGIFRFKKRFKGPFEPSLRWRLPLSLRGSTILKHGERFL